MPAHDPFPMRSEEARRLAASVEHPPSSSDQQGEEDEEAASPSWNKIGIDTAVAAPRHRAGSGGQDEYEADGSQAGGRGELLGKKTSKGKKKKKKGKKGGNQDESDGGDSIYDDLDDVQPTSSSNYVGNDDFLDAPLANRRPDGFDEMYRTSVPLWLRRILSTLGRIAKQLHARLYGDALPPHEMLRTMCLAMTLFFMIGGYWLLRSLKDPVLTALCGVAAIPKAKMASVFVVLGVVSIYNRLLDSPNLPKHKLFYVFGTFYFGLFTVISLLLSDPVIGLPNQTPDVTRVLGWVSYCAIESFGSVMVSLFWSFANSNFNLETAKASYGLLVATAQVGSILGPTVVNRYAAVWGVPRVYFVGALCMLLLQVSMYLYVKFYGSEETEKVTTTSAEIGGKAKKKEKAGVLEGLYLFARHNYVKGIFAISCLFMVEVTIVDYTMKVLARDHFAKLHPCQRGSTCWDSVLDEPTGMSLDATAAFTTFMGLFGQATNTLSFALSLFGTAAVIRTLGLRITLLLFPSLCLAVIIMVRLRPTLYVVFAAMMALKACSYALNNPTKEMLYQPTAPNVKYKAKSWIDIFGARGSKALGSVVTNAFSDSAPNLIQNGSLVGMAVATFLIWNARFMGRKFDEYMESGYIVGGENDDDDDDGGGGGGGGGGKGDYDGVKTGVEMAMVQNEKRDTSCAIYDDDEVGAEEEGQSEDDGGGGDPDDDEDDEEEEEEEEEEKGQGEQHGIARTEQV